MGLKSCIKTIRFSDEMIDIIEQQIGDNFTQKFERLVYNCCMLAEQKAVEIQILDKRIAEQRKLMRDYMMKLTKLTPMVGTIERNLNVIEHHLEEYIKEET